VVLMSLPLSCLRRYVLAFFQKLPACLVGRIRTFCVTGFGREFERQNSKSSRMQFSERTLAQQGIADRQIVGSFWVDKTPMPFRAGYLTVVPVGHDIKEIIVPRRLS